MNLHCWPRLASVGMQYFPEYLVHGLAWEQLQPALHTLR